MKKPLFFVFLSCLLFPFPTISGEIGTIRVDRSDVSGFVAYVPDEIVVKFDQSIIRMMDKTKAPKGRLGIPSLDDVGANYNAVAILPRFPKAGKKMYRNREVDLTGWHKIKFAGKINVNAVVKQYKKIPGIIEAQPIGIFTLNKIPNDGLFDKQWYLDKLNDSDIDAPEAWDLETGDENIIAAILDTGVRYFHKDLGGSGASYDNPADAAGNMWINRAEKDGVTGVDDDGNGYVDDWVGYDFVDDASSFWHPCWTGEDCDTPDIDPRDFNGHGSHVAGIVAALNNNGFAVASTAGGWGDDFLQPDGNGVRIMSLRICWSANYFWSGQEVGLCRMDFAAEALYFAADNGAKFVNASWGSDNSGGIAEALDYYLASGGIIFKAAGNEGNQSADYICGRSDPGIVSVAATNFNDCKADFSTYGNWVDIAAPGTDIYSLYHWHGDPTNDYVAWLSGTSMASPLALSVAALIWSKNPEWVTGQVVQKLFDSTDPIDDLACNASYVNKLGAGRVNALNALIAGDFNGDGDVDGTDLTTLSSAYDIGSPEADLNFDGSIDMKDIELFAEHFGMTFF